MGLAEQLDHCDGRVVNVIFDSGEHAERRCRQSCASSVVDRANLDREVEEQLEAGQQIRGIPSHPLVTGGPKACRVPVVPLREPDGNPNNVDAAARGCSLRDALIAYPPRALDGRGDEGRIRRREPGRAAASGRRVGYSGLRRRTGHGQQLPARRGRHT
jgi:hypothetical protein